MVRGRLSIGGVFLWGLSEECMHTHPILSFVASWIPFADLPAEQHVDVHVSDTPNASLQHGSVRPLPIHSAGSGRLLQSTWLITLVPLVTGKKKVLLAP